MCDVVFGINLYEESRVAKGFPSMLSYEMRSNGELWVASLLTGAAAAAVVIILLLRLLLHLLMCAPRSRKGPFKM